MIYKTGYFAKMKKYESMELLPISIAQSMPKCLTGCISYKYLAPDWELVQGFKNGTVTEDQFRNTYLDGLNRTIVEKSLQDMDRQVQKHGKSGVVLLCWEKPSNFCHRFVLSDYLKSEFGLDIEECKA